MLYSFLLCPRVWETIHVHTYCTVSLITDLNPQQPRRQARPRQRVVNTTALRRSRERVKWTQPLLESHTARRREEDGVKWLFLLGVVCAKNSNFKYSWGPFVPKHSNFELNVYIACVCKGV